MTGSGALFRFALRRDRVRLPLWVVLLALLVMGTAASWDRLYPTPGDRVQLLAILSGNPALAALLGPLSNPLSTGALTAWRISSGVLLVLALVNVFTLTRHVRAEEESGRAEVLLAAPFGRRAPLTGALLLVLLVDAVFVVLVTGLMAAVGIEVTGAVLFAATIAATALLLGTVAAVTNQVFRSARSANATASIAVLVVWLISALGNIQESWLVWLSPFGWVQQTDPFGAARWWTVLLSLAVALVLVIVAAALNRGRDLAGGLVADRRGRAAATSRLTGAHALAWRLEWPLVLGWMLTFLLAGAFVGASRDSLVEFASSSPVLSQIIERLGGSGFILDAFLATYLGFAGVATGFLAVLAVLRLDAEETAGHAEVALSTATHRFVWASAYFVLALVGAALVQLVMGLTVGVLFGVQGDQGLSQVVPVTAAALSWLAPVLLVAGLTLAIVGLVPRWSGVAWAVMTAFALVTMLGTAFGLPDWALNLSPFSHVAKAPAEAVAVAPLVWLSVAGVLLAVAGFVGIRMRDIRSG